MATYQELRQQVVQALQTGDQERAAALAAEAKAIGEENPDTELGSTPEPADRDLNPVKEAPKADDVDLNPGSYEGLRQQVVQALEVGDRARAEDLAAQAKAVKEGQQTNTFADIGRGAGAGAVNIVQGLTELGAMGIDAAFDTNTLENVTREMEGFKQDIGLVPTGAAGKVAEGLVTYGSAAIPVAGWLGRASQVAKGGRVIAGKSRWAKGAETFGKSEVGKKLLSTRAGLAGSTGLATGAADILVAPSTDETISDQFDALPEVLRTEDLESMTGRQRAYAGLRNKLRIGVEGGTIGLGVDAAMPVIGATARGVSRLPGAPTAARALSKSMDYAGDKLGKSIFLRKNFTTAGLLDKEIKENILSTEGLTDLFSANAAKLFKNWDQSVRKAMGRQDLLKRNRKGIQAAHSDLYDFMIGQLDEQEYTRRYGSKATTAAKDMRQQVDGMSDILAQQLDESNLDGATKAELFKELEENKGKYLRRLYDVHINPAKYEGDKLVKNPKYKDAVNEVTRNLQSMDSSLTSEDAAGQAAQIVANTVNGRSSDLGLTLEASTNQIAKAMAGDAAKPAGTRVPLFRVSEKMLKERNPYLTASPALRDLMGEIKDPRALYFKTVEDMGNVIAGNKFYNSIPKSDLADGVAALNAGGRPLAIAGDQVSDEAARELAKSGYVRLGQAAPLGRAAGEAVFGGAYGNLSGAFVPAELQKAITAPLRNRGGMQEALALSLQAKGLSQMSKTVLNPLSQIRNALSNNFVLLANGNWGRDMDVSESIRLLAANTADMSDPAFKKEFDMLRLTDTIGQNLVTNETKALLQEGAELPFASQTAKLAQNLSEKTKVIPLAQRMYAAGDDFFKIIGTRAEKAKYAAALRKGGLTEDRLREILPELQESGLVPRATELTGEVDPIDLMATDIVKSTMPTYSRVPDVIKSIRRVPVVGNFVAFPAEIMRTSTNILNRSLKEMSFRPSESLVAKLGQREADRMAREIRAIGAQRAAGLASAAVTLPAAATKSAHAALGVTEEQETALDRMGAPWEKGAQKMFVSKPEDGQAEYINLSYMMPYDFLLTPARAAMEAYTQNGAVDANQATKIKDMAKASLGKFLEPFASEALAAERIADVTYRGGQTQTGSIVYRDAEDDGDKVKKSVIHVMGGFLPGIVEQFFTVSGGEFVQGRTSRALTGLAGKQGQEYTPAEEAATMMTGFRRMNLDLKNNFQYKGFEYSSARRQADGILNNAISANDTSAGDVLNAYNESLRLRRRFQQQLYQDIQAAKSLGLSDRAIVTQLSEDANLGKDEIALIMRGRFSPRKPTRSMAATVLRESRVQNQARALQRLPIREMAEIYRREVNSPLIPVREETPAPEAQGAPARAAAPAQTATQRQQQQAAPAPSPAPEERQAPPAELLGGNLFDRMRNSELLRQRDEE
jgi:hypothetical protein